MRAGYAQGQLPDSAPVVRSLSRLVFPSSYVCIHVIGISCPYGPVSRFSPRFPLFLMLSVSIFYNVITCHGLCSLGYFFPS